MTPKPLSPADLAACSVCGGRLHRNESGGFYCPEAVGAYNHADLEGREADRRQAFQHLSDSYVPAPSSPDVEAPEWTAEDDAFVDALEGK